MGTLKEYLPSPITSVTFSFSVLPLFVHVRSHGMKNRPDQASRDGELVAADHYVVHWSTE